MSNEIDKELNPSNRVVRFILLILLPILVVLTTVGYFYSLGRFISTENAYIKAPIISVQSEVSGRVDMVFIKDNQRVNKGDKLFKIDTEKLELDLSEQKQNLINIIKEIENRKSKYNEAKEEVKLAKEEIKFYSSEIKRVNSLVSVEIKLAKEKVEYQKLELNRIKNLVKKGVGLQSKLDEAKFLYNSAIANLKYVNLNNDLEKGEYIDVGKILFAIVDEKNSWLEANLKETDLTNIKVGQSAYFIPDAYPDTKWKAQVQSISPATGAEFSILPPQNSSGNWVKVVQRIPVRISIGDPINKNKDNLNADKQLRVGMSVSVTIDTKYESEIPIIIRPFASIFKSLRD